MSEKFQYFNGERYTRDEKTGYYLGTHEPRTRMHRAVWQYYNGAIPKGYHIHHKNGNKADNSIENLELMPASAHLSLHQKEQNYEMQVERMNHAREFASAWHGSKAGREWHKQHYEQMKEALYQKTNFVCSNCGTVFEGNVNGHKNHFCSNKCKSAYRRKTGADNIEKVCPVCKKHYMRNKYDKGIFCSRKCAQKGRVAC